MPIKGGYERGDEEEGHLGQTIEPVTRSEQLSLAVVCAGLLFCC